MTANAKSHYAEALVLNALLRNTAFTPPATVYVGLFTAAPGEGGGGTEVSGTGYARQAATFGAPVTGTTGSSCANSADIDYSTAGSAWGTVTHFAIFDASSGGNELYYGALGASVIVNNGDPVKFATGALSVTED
jgi:hypothetical protein